MILYIFNNQTFFSARLDKQDEDNQVLDETELFIKLNFNHNLTEIDIDNIDNKSPLEQQFQNQEIKPCGWNFDKIFSMTIDFHKTGTMNGSSYVKIPLRSSAILNIENKEKYCFFWSILVKLHSCKNSQPNRVLKCRQFFDELNNEGFDFSNGVKCIDFQEVEKLSSLSINIIELNFYQAQKNWRIIMFY